MEFHQRPISSLSGIFFLSVGFVHIHLFVVQPDNMKPNVHLRHLFRIHALRLYSIFRRLRSVEAAECLVYWMGCDWSGFVRLLITCSLYLSTETPSCSFEHGTCRWNADALWAVGKKLEPAAGEGLESKAFLQGAKKLVTLDRALHKGPRGWGRMERVTRGCSWLSLS